MTEPIVFDPNEWDEFPPWEVTPEVEPPQQVEVLRPFRRLSLDLEKAPEPPKVLVSWLYAGCLTILQSEPGAGKSWIATWLVAQLVADGYTVVFIDEEGGPELMTERLVALGADPQAVRDLVFYYAFEHRRWDEEDLIALDAVISTATSVGRGLALVVLDSLPDFLAAAGLSEDSSMDVTSFVKRVCDRFRAVGAAQLLLDHLVKPPSDGKARRSRYGRGSGAKLAKADTSLLLEAIEEFDAQRSGRLRLWKTKDRRGRLELPTLMREGLVLGVTVERGAVRIEPTTASAARRPFRPTLIMERVSIELEQARATALSKRSLRSLVRGDNNVVDAAVEALIADGFARQTSRGVVVVKPFRHDGEPVDNSAGEQPEWEF